MLQTRESSTAKSPPKMPFSFAASAAPGAAYDAMRHVTESTTSTTAPRGRAPFRPSQEADSTGPCEPESRLQHLMRNRYYDPKAGRFTAEDPLPDVNLYRYVENDPLNLTDPFGLSTMPWSWIYMIEKPIVQAGEATIGLTAAAAATIGGVVVGVLGNPATADAPGVDSITSSSSESTTDADTRKCKEEDPCWEPFLSCLTNPWQPKWNRRDYGKRKDCGACYRECKHAGGAWPYYKCP